MKTRTNIQSGLDCSGQWQYGEMLSSSPWRLFLNVRGDDGAVYETIPGTQFNPFFYFPQRGDRVGFSVFNAGTPDAGKVECLGMA